MKNALNRNKTNSCNILDAICIKLHENHFMESDCRPGMTAFLLTTWLGYMNSFCEFITHNANTFFFDEKKKLN
ncbi:hypothetical protein QR98_0099740 [Sarcoptes scabiei]|uniref:Uncharacterized protein n=1 Tax=Sarcoptes scabiei TaxID=52283 RepID=A0A132AKF2_SARSC|nr:hypothetical protein QR98_0099740 [Sarcoptes scabiei]